MNVNSTNGALKGLRVLDFGQYLAAPMAAMFLADNGADVIHIDPPSGPSWQHPANAALYRGKRSIRIDLKSEPGLAHAKRLIAGADVVLENFRPGVMTRLGLDPAEMSGANRRLIWCSMPGFPSNDPRASLRAWEGTICAAVGLYPPPGLGEGDPVFTALPLASSYGSFMAAHRIAAALYARQATGAGIIMEVSLFEAGFQGLGFAVEQPPSRTFSDMLLTKIRPAMGIRKTADSDEIYFDSPLRGLQRFLDRFLPGRKLILMSEAEVCRLADDLDALFITKSAREWEAICQEELQGAFGLAQPIAAWMEDAHALESETLVQVKDYEHGDTVQAGFSVLMSVSKPAVRSGRCSAQTDIEGVDWLEDQLRLPVPGRDKLATPLSGLRVLDLSSLLAGPTTARVLAQYGADVIKVDSAAIAKGDVDPLSDESVAFVGARTVSAGKRMIFLNLKSGKGRDVLESLVKEADVLHHNFTPEAASRLGVSERQLRAINPAIIVSTMSLHSYGGFRSDYRGHDMLAQMVTGMGHRHGGSTGPQIQSTFLNDNAAGHLNAFGILLALLHRSMTGEGQAVNASLSRTATLHQLPFMVKYAGRVWDEPHGPDALGWHTFDRLYQALDGWFYVAAEPHYGQARLQGHAGFEELAAIHPDRVEGWLVTKFRSMSVADCVGALLSAGFSAQRHCSPSDLAEDPQVTKDQLLVTAEHIGLGRARGIGLHVYDGTPARARSLLKARRPGADTVEVLRDHGLEARLAELLAEGVIAIDDNDILNYGTA